jgi:hypothetical protein
LKPKEIVEIEAQMNITSEIMTSCVLEDLAKGEPQV